MTCIKSFRCCLNDFFNRNVSDNDFHFYFWKYGNIHLNSTIFFSRTFLDSTSHNLRYCHSCYTQIIESGFQPFIFGQFCDNNDFMHSCIQICCTYNRNGCISLYFGCCIIICHTQICIFILSHSSFCDIHDTEACIGRCKTMFFGIKSDNFFFL